MRGLLDSLLEIRLADAVDIVLVTFLVYAAHRLDPAHAGRRWSRAGSSSWAALYIAARSFGLQLTAWLLQGFFAIFLIIVVVIFQEELRQLFERLALFRCAAASTCSSRPT